MRWLLALVLFAAGAEGAVQFVLSTTSSYTLTPSSGCTSGTTLTEENGMRYDRYIWGNSPEENLKQVHVFPTDVTSAFCLSEETSEYFTVVLHQPSGDRSIVTSFYYYPSLLV
eukprot:Hpha_TRINITY_DN18674_c0_g1::TRINITY_DN18674_c0_g1_i1::g.115646::m.115646